MAIRTKKFRIGHGDEVRAVQVTAENHVDIAKWVKHGVLALSKQGDEEGVETNQRVRVRTPFGLRTAEIGDWVYKNLSDEKFYVAKDAEVEEKFISIAPVPRKKKEEK